MSAGGLSFPRGASDGRASQGPKSYRKAQPAGFRPSRGGRLKAAAQIQFPKKTALRSEGRCSHPNR